MSIIKRILSRQWLAFNQTWRLNNSCSRKHKVHWQSSSFLNSSFFCLRKNKIFSVSERVGIKIRKGNESYRQCKKLSNLACGWVKVFFCPGLNNHVWEFTFRGFWPRGSWLDHLVITKINRFWEIDWKVIKSKRKLVKEQN